VASATGEQSNLDYLREITCLAGEGGGLEMCEVRKVNILQEKNSIQPKPALDGEESSFGRQGNYNC